MTDNVTLGNNQKVKKKEKITESNSFRYLS